MLLRAVRSSTNHYSLFRLHDIIGRWQGSIYYSVPLPALQRRQFKVEVFPFHVKHDVNIHVFWTAFCSKTPHRERQRSRGGIVPARTIQMAPMPFYILQTTSIHFTIEEPAAMQDRVISAKVNHHAKETEEVLMLLYQIPVEPVDLVILAIRIIVALLCSPDLVAGNEHGNALREHQDGSEVLDLPVAQGLDIG